MPNPDPIDAALTDLRATEDAVIDAITAADTAAHALATAAANDQAAKASLVNARTARDTKRAAYIDLVTKTFSD